MSNDNTHYLLQLPNGDQFSITGNIETDNVLLDTNGIKIPHYDEQGNYATIIIPQGSLLIPLEQAIQPTRESVAAMDAELQKARSTVATLEGKLKAERSCLRHLGDKLEAIKATSLADADKLVQQERQLSFLACMTVAFFITGLVLAFKLWG